MTASPPPYNFASTSRLCDAPLYSAQPAKDECILEHSPSSARPRPTGTYTRTERFMNLTLKEQAAGAAMPAYGRHGLVKGELAFARPQDILSVEIKIEGEVVMMLGRIGRPAPQTFLDVKRKLWAPASAAAPQSACPAVLAFDIKLPATFRGREAKAYPLPPTCEMAFDSSTISCRYSLKIAVTSASRFVKKRKSSTVAFSYEPRTPLPTPPLPPGTTFLASLLVAPEAWFDVPATVQVKPKSGVAPIKCHLYIPSDQVYSAAAPIPFHLELTAPSASLRALYHSQATSTSKKAPVRVSVVRHVHANCYGTKIQHALVVGESALHALPPPPPVLEGKRDAGREDVLRWDGVLALGAQAAVGGFAVGDILSIKDFIVLEVAPPGARSAPLVELVHKHPIRLVAE
ncbi:hypothetical protein HWV62_16582 [Athelia sp. TMB]|nr:hypothetical protein HWV62_16582 [Athelia sp. TMB]